MELSELVSGLRIIELTAKTRGAALRSLVQAANWEDEGIKPEKVLEAIEEREAVAHTLVTSDLALPHAAVDWDGDFRVVLGRSRPGIDFGTPGADRVRLIVLVVIGRGGEKVHLELLASLAQLLKDGEFRQKVANARDARSIENLIREEAGLQPEARPTRNPGVPRLSTILVRQAIGLVDAISAQALLLAAERLEVVPWELLSAWEGRLILVTSDRSDDFVIERPDTHLFDVRHVGLSRMDRANLGLLLATASGLLTEKSSVVCVTGVDGRPLDCISVNKPEPQLRAMFSSKAKRSGDLIRPPVLLRVLSLAIEIASEGREGKSVGTTFVIGDSRQVLRHVRQLVLNPFHGFSRQIRNVLDPSLGETIKEFATIDGAFLVQGDGTVLSAGTYLIPKAASTNVPAGLGTRHQTAAAITAQTQAMAITVSQSTGTVTVFRKGAIVFTLERAGMTKW